MLAVLLAIVGLFAGFGANAVITKQRLGSADEKAKKKPKNWSNRLVRNPTKPSMRRAKKNRPAAKNLRTLSSA